MTKPIELDDLSRIGTEQHPSQDTSTSSDPIPVPSGELPETTSDTASFVPSPQSPPIPTKQVPNDNVSPKHDPITQVTSTALVLFSRETQSGPGSTVFGDASDNDNNSSPTSNFTTFFSLTGKLQVIFNTILGWISGWTFQGLYSWSCLCLKKLIPNFERKIGEDHIRDHPSQVVTNNPSVPDDTATGGPDNDTGGSDTDPIIVDNDIYFDACDTDNPAFVVTAIGNANYAANFAQTLTNIAVEVIRSVNEAKNEMNEAAKVTITATTVATNAREAATTKHKIRNYFAAKDAAAKATISADKTRKAATKTDAAVIEAGILSNEVSKAGIAADEAAVIANEASDTSSGDTSHAMAAKRSADRAKIEADKVSIVTNLLSATSDKARNNSVDAKNVASAADEQAARAMSAANVISPNKFRIFMYKLFKGSNKWDFWVTIACLFTAGAFTGLVLGLKNDTPNCVATVVKHVASFTSINQENLFSVLINEFISRHYSSVVLETAEYLYSLSDHKKLLEYLSPLSEVVGNNIILYYVDASAKIIWNGTAIISLEDIPAQFRPEFDNHMAETLVSSARGIASLFVDESTPGVGKIWARPLSIVAALFLPIFISAIACCILRSRMIRRIKFETLIV